MISYERHQAILKHLEENKYATIKELSKINLKPIIFSSIEDIKTNDSSEYYSAEEEALKNFCKLTPKNNIVNFTTTEVYEKFVDFRRL